MEGLAVFSGLVGGLGLFLFGMKLAGEGLQKAAANKLKSILTRLTSNRLVGVVMGFLVTILLQSSSTTTVLMISFVSASLIDLSQALGVMLGAAVGATLTVQIIAFKIANYARFLVGIGIMLVLGGKRQQTRGVGEAVLGFGILFYGMQLISEAIMPLRTNQGFMAGLVALSSNWPLTIIVSAVFSAVMQGSAPVIALAMSLVGNGVLSLDVSLPIVLGANVGTTAKVFLSSLASSREAKRLALAYFLFKLFGVVLFVPFLGLFTHLVRSTAADAGRQIANAHTIFNVLIAVVFLPLTGVFGSLVSRLLPDREEKPYQVKYLDEKALSVPEIALSQARSEIIRMGHLVRDVLLPEVMRIFRTENEKMTERLKEQEQKLDFLHKMTSRYLADIAQRDLTEKQSEEIIKLFYVSKDLEHIGDIVMEILGMALKLRQHEMVFTGECIEEVQSMHHTISHNLENAIRAFDEDSVMHARLVITNYPEILRLERGLRYNYFVRFGAMEKQDGENIGPVYLDLINNLLRINSHAVNISQAVVGII